MKFDVVPIRLPTGFAYWLAPKASSVVSWDHMNEREYFEDCLTHLLGNTKVASEYVFFIASDLNDPAYLLQFRKTWSNRQRPQAIATDDIEPVDIDPKRKPVLIYLSRESAVPVSSKTAGRFHTVFQTPLTVPWVGQRVFPLQIGAFNGAWCREQPAEHERNVELFFAGMLTTARAKVLTRISDRRNWRTLFFVSVAHVPSNRILQNSASVVSPPPLAKSLRGKMIFTSRWASGVAPELYKAQLLNARIVLCLRGNICAETYRHYEAASAGCVVVTPRLPKTYVFRDNPFIEIDSIEGWLPALRALANEGDEAMAKRGEATRQFWENRLSPKATADYVCRQLNSEAAL